MKEKLYYKIAGTGIAEDYCTLSRIYAGLVIVVVEALTTGMKLLSLWLRAWAGKSE
jgi:hypothetical protein